MRKAVMLYAEGRSCYLDRAYPEEVKKEIEKEYELFPMPISSLQIDKHAEELEAAEAVFASWWMPELTVEQIRQYFPNLKILFYAAGSVQYFARPFMECGVRVVSGWAANGVPVAEYAAAQIVLANKGFFQNVRRMRADYDRARDYSDSFCGNYGAKAGILGVGAVGSQVISLLHSHEMEVWAYDPWLTEERAEALGTQRHSLEEIFESCDVISNHVAQLPETEGMISYDLLSRMKPYATLINTGRGSQIAEDDLVRAMKEVPSRTAVLDVTDPEPPKADSELYKQENIILTTHIAGSMGKEIGRIGQYIAEEARRYAHGAKLRYEISEASLKTMA